MRQKFYGVLILSILLSGCAHNQKKTDVKRYQSQVNKLSKKLAREKNRNQNLRDENNVLRQLAGLPAPALKRVKKESRAAYQIGSEKFIYRQIQRAFKQKNRKKLESSIKLLRKRYPTSKYTDNAIYLSGLLDLRQGLLASALSKFDNVIDKFPKANARPASYLGKGLAYKQLNLKDQARLVFEELIGRYPNTPETVRAKREILALN